MSPSRAKVTSFSVAPGDKISEVTEADRVLVEFSAQDPPPNIIGNDSWYFHLAS